MATSRTWHAKVWSNEPAPPSQGKVSAGQAVLLDRERGHCLLCHQIAQLAEHPEGSFQGNIGTDLSNVGNRLTAAQLRKQVAEPMLTNPSTIMPSYHLPPAVRRKLTNVASSYANQPILSTSELTDLVAFLTQLKKTPSSD